MKVFVVDSKLRKHSVNVDDSTSVAHVKLLLANLSLVPAGFVPELVYQKRMLSNNECIGRIGYIPERCLSLVCVRSTQASTAVQPERQSSRATECNPPAAAQLAHASPAVAANTAVPHVSALFEAHSVIFSMGFDELLVQRALARTGGNEQDAIEILIGGSEQLNPDDPNLSSSRDAALPVIFSMGFDDALVRRALDSAGGDEEQALELLLSGRLPSLEQYCSAPANVRKPVPAGTFIPLATPVLGSSASAAIPSSAPSNLSLSSAPAINFATEWLDDDGCVCPKNVDYASHCPKGHTLVPLVGSGGSQAQPPGDADLICRVCHGSTQRQHACDWLVCSVAACCGGYAVCAACVTALGSAHRAAAARPDDFCMMVMPLACELKQCLASSLLWLCVFDFALTSIFRAFPCSICSCCRRSSAAHGGVV